MITIVSVFPPYRGGIATFSDYLYQNLKTMADIEAINFSHLYPGILFPGKTQFDIHKKQTEYAKRVIHSWNPFNWGESAEKILETDPDQVLFTYWHPFFAAAYLRIVHLIKKKKPGVKISVLAHNVMPHERFPFGEKLSQKLLNTADKILLLSEKSLNEANALHIESEISVLFHPVYEQPFPGSSRKELREKYGFREEDYIPLFFGLVRPYKGLDIFINALNSLDLKMDQIKPLIAGEFYTDKTTLLSQIEPEHKSDYTVIDRFVSDQEMAELFFISDVLVMPYRSATQSGILANAINFLLPSIVTDLKGLTEHIDHGKTAWIVPKEDPSELAKAIKKLSEAEIRTDIKKRLIPLKEKLSWQNFSTRLLSEISKENP